MQLMQCIEFVEYLGWLLKPIELLRNTMVCRKHILKWHVETCICTCVQGRIKGIVGPRHFLLVSKAK